MVFSNNRILYSNDNEQIIAICNMNLTEIMLNERSQA